MINDSVGNCSFEGVHGELNGFSASSKSRALNTNGLDVSYDNN